MVQLILSSTKGNQGGKYFPYIGYLGLTPVRVEGIVRTKLDSDFKTLPCKSLTISVRCYESRIGRVQTLQSNILVDYTQTLWSKADDVDYEQVGLLEFPFRIWIPTQTKGFSTAVFVDYRCSWRVEAVLNHAPITGVGSRQMRHFELPLVRYDVPRPLVLSDPPGIVFDHQTTKPKAPRVQYCLRMPSLPTGPLDLVSIPLHMQPVDQGVTIRGANVVIERRIQLHDMSAAPAHSLASSISAIPSHQPTVPSSTSSSSLNSLPQSQISYFNSSQRPSSPPSPARALSSQQHSPISPTNMPLTSSQQYHHQPTHSTSSLASSNPTITPETVYPSNASVITYSSEHPLLSSTASYSSQPAQLPTHSSSQPPTPNGTSGSHGQSAIQTASTSSAPPSSYSSPFSFTSGSPSSAKVVVNCIAGTETENFTRDPRGIWSKTLTLQWPASKSHSRWAIGETINSDLVSVRYFVRVKITVTSPSGGSDTIELAEKELLVVSTNESERQLALVKYAELAESSSGAAMSSDFMVRSKSKSPRRFKPDKDGRLPPDLPPSPAPPAASSRANGERRTKTPRRPHTSAGPRDKSTLTKIPTGSSSTVDSGSAEQHRKRRSELGWAHPSSHSSPQTPDYESLWDGYARVESRNGASREQSGKARSPPKGSERPASKGQLPSTSFWAVSAPPHSDSGSGSSRDDKGTRSAGAIMGTHSTSTTASSSSVSSSRSGTKYRRENEISVAYSSSGTDEEEERRRRRRHQQSPAQSLAMSPSPPSSYQYPRDTSSNGGHSHVREWEEELARIEEKSRKESDAAGFGRMRKRSLMSTVKGFLSSSGNTSS